MSISNDKKKELKEEYKNATFQVGVFVIRCNETDKCLVVKSKDLKSSINSVQFKLERGMHPNKVLQEDWNQYGQNKFNIEILEELEFEEGIILTDLEIEQELNALEDEWLDVLENEDMMFY